MVNERIMISDTGNYVIRIISTVAGGSSPGYYGDGGLAINSLLNKPASITIDAKGTGNLFISDTGNYVIRMVSATEKYVYTVAGRVGMTGFGGDFGPAGSALLGDFTNVVVDLQGNLLIADLNNHRIRLVFSSNSLLTEQPSSQPSTQPSVQPSMQPSVKPSRQVLDYKVDWCSVFTEFFFFPLNYLLIIVILTNYLLIFCSLLRNRQQNRHLSLHVSLLCSHHHNPLDR
jgi:hypothetical protein